MAAGAERVNMIDSAAYAVVSRLTVHNYIKPGSFCRGRQSSALSSAIRAVLLGDLLFYARALSSLALWETTGNSRM